MPEDPESDPLTPIKTAAPEVQNIIKRVLQLEKEMLYQQEPHLTSDLVKIIKEEVQ